MVQAFLPNNLPKNIVNYSVFHPCCSNGPSLLAKRIVPNHVKGLGLRLDNTGCCPSQFRKMKEYTEKQIFFYVDRALSFLFAENCKTPCFLNFLPNMQIYAKQKATKHCRIQRFLSFFASKHVILCQTNGYKTLKNTVFS